MGKTIDQFDAVATPATTDTLLVTQSAVAKKETIQQVITAMAATDAVAVAATSVSALLTPANIAALKATNAEVVNGTSTTQLVTPAGLAAKTATSAAIGLIEIATDAEGITGTDTGRALTAANLKAVLQGLAYALNMAKVTDISGVPGLNDIGAATGNFITLTGATTITGLGTAQAGTQRIVHFQDSGSVLTHNDTSLILPSGEEYPSNPNITIIGGDIAEFISLGSGNWRCTRYMRADGRALYHFLVETVLAADISTTSTTWVAAGSAAISATVKVGRAGKALITINSSCANTGGVVYFQINRDSGTDYRPLGGAYSGNSGQPAHFSGSKLFTGLPYGNHTFSVEYRVGGGTGYIRPASEDDEMMNIIGQSW